VDQFINFLPGKSKRKKILNFISLFGLEKNGYLHPDNNEWVKVGIVGVAYLSRMNENDNIYGVKWDDDDGQKSLNAQRFPIPFIACEDCST
jgi:hypothetical protein